MNPKSTVPFAIEDAFLSLLKAAGVAGVEFYGTAEAAGDKMADNRCTVLAGAVEPEFRDAPTDSQVAANVIVPVTISVVSNVAPTKLGGVVASDARNKHLLAFGQIKDALLTDSLVGDLNAQSIEGVSVNFISWQGDSATQVENGKYRTETTFNVHACAV